MRLARYRDIDGRIIPRELKPCPFPNSKDRSGGRVAAQLVYCMYAYGLISVASCRMCRMYHGEVRHSGVRCSSVYTGQPPICYNDKEQDLKRTRRRKGEQVKTIINQQNNKQNESRNN